MKMFVFYSTEEFDSLNFIIIFKIKQQCRNESKLKSENYVALQRVMSHADFISKLFG
jgi:uncharacterized phage-like protein YoqJ